MADNFPTPRKCANEGCGGTKFPWASAPTCNKCYHKETRKRKRKAEFEGYRLQLQPDKAGAQVEQGQHQLSLGNVHFPGLQELGREAPSSAPFPNVPGTGVAAILQGAVPAGLTYPPFAVTATEATAPAALSTFAAAAGFAPFAPFAPFAAGAAPTASAAHAPASFFIPGAPMPRQQLLSYPSLARPALPPRGPPMPSSIPSAPIQTLAYAAATDLRSMDARDALPDNNNYKALEASHTHGHALVIAGGSWGPGRLAALSLSDERNSSASDGLVHILNEHNRPAIEAAQRGVAYGRAVAPAICHALGVPPPPNEKLVSTIVAVVGGQGVRVDGASIAAGIFVEHALHQLCGISLSGTAVTGAMEANGQVRPVERMQSKAQAVECGRQVRTVPTAPSSLIAAAFCPDQEGAPQEEPWQHITHADDIIKAKLGEAAFERLERHLEVNPLMLGRAYALLDSEQAVSVTVLFILGVGRQMVTGMGVDEFTERLVLDNIHALLQQLPAWINGGGRVHLNAQHVPVDSSNGSVLDVLVAFGDGTTVATGEALVPAALVALISAAFSKPAGEQRPLPVVMGSLYGFQYMAPLLLTLRERVMGIGRGVKYVDEILPVLHDIAGDEDADEVVFIAPPETAKQLGRSRRHRFELRETRRVQDFLHAIGVTPNPFAPEPPLIAPHPVPLPRDCSHRNVGRFFGPGEIIPLEGRLHMAILDFLARIKQGAQGKTVTRGQVARGEAAAASAAAAAAALQSGLPIEALVANPQAMAAYKAAPFDHKTPPSEVLQFNMLSPGMTNAMLRAAVACNRGYGFYGDTTPKHAPPAPEEVQELVQAILDKSGALLAGQTPLSIIVNWTKQGKGGHGAHWDPVLCSAIVGFNLSGTVDVELVDPKHTSVVVYRQKVGPGCAYVLTGEAVTHYKHRITSPTGADRYVMIVRFVQSQVLAELQAAAAAVQA